MAPGMSWSSQGLDPRLLTASVYRSRSVSGRLENSPRLVLNLVLGKEREKEKEKEEGGRESGSRVQEELALGSAGFQLLSSTRD